MLPGGKGARRSGSDLRRQARQGWGDQVLDAAQARPGPRRDRGAQRPARGTDTGARQRRRDHRVGVDRPLGERAVWVILSLHGHRTSAVMSAALLAGLASALLGAGSAVAATHARPPSARPRSITLQWVGDIALSSERGLPPGGLIRALRPVAAQLRDAKARHAELTLGNLEGTLSVGGTSKCGGGPGEGTCFAFQAPPSTARQLRALGFGLLNQANNHSMD